MIRTSLLCLVTALSLAGCAHNLPQTPEPVSVKLIAINDFHGRLTVDPNDTAATVAVKENDAAKRVFAGGAAYLATLVAQLRAQAPHSVFVSAGDNIGAAQSISVLTSEEASIDVLNTMGLELSATGNHEFDAGKDELLRMQYGGCRVNPPPGKSTCLVSNPSTPDGKFGGARFTYLAANIIDEATGKTLFDATHVKKFGTASIGFIGVTLQATQKSTRGAAGLGFLDEADTINRYAATLKQKGVDAIVVLIHQGGQTKASYINDTTCPGMTGPLQPIVAQLRHVDVVISAHTHHEYLCTDPATGILYTSAGYYGRLVTDIDLKIVPGQGVIEKTARTLPVINALNTPQTLPSGHAVLTEHPATRQVIDAYDQETSKLLNEVKGYMGTPLSNCRGAQSIETPLGNVVADAFLDSYLARDKSARNVVAFMNPGGIRASLPRPDDGAVTFGALTHVLPFGNRLVYVDLTGKQLKRLLEQQWEAANCKSKALTATPICGRLLQPARTLRYTWDWQRGQGKPNGQGNLLVSAEVLDLASKRWNPVTDDQIYRVVTNEYLADGGDRFTIFKGVEKHNTGHYEIQALADYFGKTLPSSASERSNKSSPSVSISPIDKTVTTDMSAALQPPKARITCRNCPETAPADAALCEALPDMR